MRVSKPKALSDGRQKSAPSGISSTPKLGDNIGANKICGAKTPGVCKEQFYCSYYLHDLWSNYPRSIRHVIDLVYEKWGQAGGKPKYWQGRGLQTPIETPVRVV